MSQISAIKLLNSSLNRSILDAHVVQIDAAGSPVESQINQFAQSAKQTALATDSDVVLAMLLVK